MTGAWPFGMRILADGSKKALVNGGRVVYLQRVTDRQRW